MTTCTVLGGAPCLHDDLAAIGDTDLVVAINDAAYTFTDIDAVATLHPEHVPRWRRRRLSYQWPDVPWYSFKGEQYGCTVWRVEDRDALTTWTRGSSGLYAVGVATHALQADRVYLAGVPMDASPNLYRDEDEWRAHRRYRVGWEKAKAKGWLGHVRSPSGWTADLLGRPEWLKAA